VPHHWCNGVIAGFLPKDQTGDNVMTWGQDCKVDSATLSIQNWW
jgi:hypothetical protein